MWTDFTLLESSVRRTCRDDWIKRERRETRQIPPLLNCCLNLKKTVKRRMNYEIKKAGQLINNLVKNLAIRYASGKTD